MPFMNYRENNLVYYSPAPQFDKRMSVWRPGHLFPFFLLGFSSSFSTGLDVSMLFFSRLHLSFPLTQEKIGVHTFVFKWNVSALKVFLLLKPCIGNCVLCPLLLIRGSFPALFKPCWPLFSALLSAIKQISSTQARRVSCWLGQDGSGRSGRHGCFSAPAALNSSCGAISCADCRSAPALGRLVSPGAETAPGKAARRLGLTGNGSRPGPSSPAPMPAARPHRERAARAPTLLQKAGRKRELFRAFSFLKYGIHRGGSSFSNGLIGVSS